MNHYSPISVRKNKTFKDCFIISYYCPSCKAKHQHGIGKEDFGTTISRVAHHLVEPKLIYIDIPFNPHIHR